MSEFKSSSIYQIYIKSFSDSDGDGIGDLNGIRKRLPYIGSLGVDYVWITPFFCSPMQDNGYDIADYFSVNPVFGSMEDAEALIREAEEMGIGLMFDMVFNHTSTSHEWFQKALQGDPRYMDYYIFREGKADAPPTNWQSKFGGSAWEYVPALDKYYLHLFDVTQADLNWENPEVREELKKVILFWKNKGLRGFRFDVVNLISKPQLFQDDTEGDGRRFYTDGRHVHDFLKELVEDTGIRDMVTVGEMSSTSIESCIRYTGSEEKELSMCFSFHHLKVDYLEGEKWALMPPDLGCLREIFRSWQEKMQEGNGWNAVFWCNHDQPRVVSRFGEEGELRRKSAKMLATMIHMMRGTPFIYQGEELGMTNPGFRSIAEYRDVESINYYQILREEGKSEEEALSVIAERSRDNARTPMQWDGSRYAGFSEAEPWIGIPENHKWINAETEEADKDSVLWYYRRLIRLRKDFKLISEGRIRFLESGEEQILVYERTWKGERLTVYCNFSGETLSCRKHHGADAGLLIGNYSGEEAPPLEKFALRPYEALVFHEAQAKKQELTGPAR